MGICSSSSLVGYEELRNSIPGSMLADQQDFDLFYSLCKVETVGSISTAVHPSPTQLFYVVVSGQVVIHLSSPTIPNMCGTTFSKGDMIHFFNSPLQPVTKLDHTCLRNGSLKMSLQFKGYTEKMGRVIGMDRKGWEIFVATRYEKKKKLQSLLNLDMTKFISTSNNFYTLTPQQVQILGPMLKIRLAEKGGLVCFPSRQNVGVAKNFTSAGTVGILLAGTCLSLPANENIDNMVEKLKRESPKSSSASTRESLRHAPSPRHRLGKAISRLFSHSSRRGSQQQVHHTSTSLRSVVSIPISVSDSTQKGRASFPVQSGTIMGLDKFFMRSPDIAMRKYLATSSSCIVGYITPKILDSLCEIDPRFLRVVARNFYGIILSWLRPTVSLLNGMDDASFAKLHSKVYLKGFTTGSIIYERDTPSDTAYIILHGSVSSAMMVKEQVPDDPAQMPGRQSGYNNNNISRNSSHRSMHTHEQELEREQLLGWGAMFGDVALVTNRNYFTTTTAREPVMTLAISKKTIENIYFENKAKLCEIRIRLVGAEVDLLHVIDHPFGSEQFQLFLTQTMATENLLFYHAVDRFESMCLAVLKLFEETKRIRAKLDKNIASVKDLRRSESLLSGLKIGQTPRQSFTGVLATDAHAVGARGATADGPASGRIETVNVLSTDSVTHRVLSSDSLQSPGSGANIDTESMSRMLAEFDQFMPTNLPSVQLQQDLCTSGDETDRDRERIPSKQFSVNTEAYDAGSIVDLENGTDRDADVLEGLPRFQFQASSNPQLKPLQVDTTQPGEEAALHEADNGRKRLRKKSALRSKMFAGTPQSQKKHQPNAEDISNALAEAHVGAPLESNRLYDAHAAAVLEQINQVLFGKIQRKIGRVQECMVELKEAARSMMQTFIYEKAPSQVNISSATRKEMERRFQEWDMGNAADRARESSLKTLRAQAIQNAHSAGVTAPGDSANITNNALSRQNSSERGVGVDFSGVTQLSLDMDFTSLFDEAKSEVLRMMRLDSFQRWKRTPEFATFIKTFQRIETLEIPEERRESTENSDRPSVNESVLVGAKNTPDGNNLPARPPRSPVAAAGAGVVNVLRGISSKIVTPNLRGSSSVTPVKTGQTDGNGEDDSFANS